MNESPALKRPESRMPLVARFLALVCAAGAGYALACGDSKSSAPVDQGTVAGTGGTGQGGAGAATTGGVGSNGGAALSSGGAVLSSGGAMPSSGGAVPSSGGAEPSSGGAMSSSGGAVPSSGGAEPSSGGAVPSSGGAVPSSGGAPPAGGAAPDNAAKARVIASTDGEVDDRSSMVRFLLYASDYDVIGFIENNSIFQKRGHSKDGWLAKVIGYYGEVLPNLKKHHPDYPDVAYLKSVMTVGNESEADLCKPPPEMGTKDTPGSDLIIKALLDSDPRPVHVPCWGGANTVAFALWRLKQNKPAEFAAAAARLRVYGITYNLTDKAQDCGYKWIIDNMPEVKIYTAATWAGTYSYDSVDGKRGRASKNPKEIQVYFDDPWLEQNIKQNHGALGAYSPQSYTSEGDTPSFLPLVNNGLLAHLDYTWGGWGGRAQIASGNHMVDAENEDGDKWAAVYRWSVASQNDFAARADWSVATEFSGANHPPKAKVAGGTSIAVAGGATVNLDASETTDPDGNAMTFKWWQYHEADSAAAKVSISNATAQTGASFAAPSEPGKQVHIILEVKDNGMPSLTHYQRVLVDIQ